MQPPIIGRIDAFVRGERRDSFADLVAGAFAFQRHAIPAIDRLAHARGLDAGPVVDWRCVPAVPAGSFAEVTLAAAAAAVTFRSSGTTGGARSVHHHAFPDLYRTVIDASFPGFCLDHALCAPSGGRPPMLALVPPRDQVADSSLGFMVDHVLRRFGATGSAYAFGPRGADAAAASRVAASCIQAGRPLLVLATAFALVQWLDDLAEAGDCLRLPAGSVVFETGGTKGRVRAVGRAELVQAIGDLLGVPPARVVREYGMTELTSQLYGQALLGNDPELLVAPPWARVHVLDPVTLEPAATGTAGLIAVFDLANVGSALHVVTEDLGRAEAGGIRLLGRAAGADLRGCSLTVEELAGEAFQRGRGPAAR